MRNLVERVTDSGLVLWENRQDGAAVARALQRLDPNFSLRVDQNGLWRVYYNDQGRDLFVLAWQDAVGQPRQLSMDLVDEVKKRDRTGRADPKDADYLNEQVRREIQRQKENDLEAILSDHDRAIKTNRLSVGF